MPMIGQRCGFMLLKRSVSRNYIDAAVHPKRAISRKFQEASSENMILQLRGGQNNVNVRKIDSATEIDLTTIKDESRELMAIWPDVVRDLTDGSQHPDIPEVNKRMAKVLEYNVLHGKPLTAIVLVNAYKHLIPPDQLTEDKIRLARILGWCAELIQAFIVVFDDMYDGSTVRRGKPAWYLHSGHGSAAINDGIFLEKAIYQLLRTHFQHKDCYIDLVNTFQEVTLNIVMGQCLDILLTNHGDASIFNLFTMDRYNALCTYKIGYYFMLPASAAMHFAELKDREMHKQAQTVLIELGRLFQAENDYIDCYGDRAITGKDESDIQEGKCTWLVVVALQRATTHQKKILEECYGSKDPEKIAKIKQLYNDLGLPDIFATYKEESYSLLNTHMQQTSCRLPYNLFYTLADRAHRRTQ